MIVPDRKPLAGLKWIAVDWGTSSLRVWAMGSGQVPLGHVVSAQGMNSLAPKDFEPVLQAIVEPWLSESRGETFTVCICGMAGARQGWREAGYRRTPCVPVVASSNLLVSTRDPRLRVLIVPGLSQAEPADVMRGEETQLAGLAASVGRRELVACLPGTHSKWARLSEGNVVGFRTFMTGELFSLLCSDSILRHSVNAADDRDDDAFQAAVEAMLEEPASLSAELFSIRAAGLLQDVSPGTARSRLSGLLIGAELAATRSLWQVGPVHVVGSPALTSSYVAALTWAGAHVIVEDAEALTLAGLRLASANEERLADGS